MSTRTSASPTDNPVLSTRIAQLGELGNNLTWNARWATYRLALALSTASTAVDAG